LEINPKKQVVQCVLTCYSERKQQQQQPPPPPTPPTPTTTTTTELLLTFLKVQKRRHISSYSFMQVLTLLEMFEMPQLDSSNKYITASSMKKKKNAPPISKFSTAGACSE